MTWKSIAERKYDQGINNMEAESDRFLAIINSFNQKMNFKTEGELKHSDLLPEGGAWLLHLDNEDDVYAELCTYEIQDDKIKYIWVEFLPESRELVAEINRNNGEVLKEVLLNSERIIEFYPGDNSN